MRVDVPRLLQALRIDSPDADTNAIEIWACCPCPDHDEATASWSIRNDPSSDRHGYHFCFGCEFNGGPAKLVDEVLGLSGYSAATAWLKERKLDLEGTAPMAVEVFLKMPGTHSPLEPPFGIREQWSTWTTNARRYAEKRGITESQAKRWRVGCVPMEGRIYIPVYDRDDNLLSYTARDYTGEARSRYKEPHGKGMDGSHPGAIFGEAYWSRIEFLQDELIVCEGAFNAMACERVGTRNLAALYGSTLSKQQLLKLKAFRSIVVAADIDKAGNKMARKIWASLSRWKNVRRVDFPDKRDPNDLEREDPDLLRRLLWPPKAL